MIDFRYHLVSIVAVFLALAIGIVLGSTELQGTTYNFLDRTTAKLTRRVASWAPPRRKPTRARLTRRRSSPRSCGTCCPASGS